MKLKRILNKEKVDHAEQIEDTKFARNEEMEVLELTKAEQKMDTKV